MFVVAMTTITTGNYRIIQDNATGIGWWSVYYGERFVSAFRARFLAEEFVAAVICIPKVAN